MRTRFILSLVALGVIGAAPSLADAQRRAEEFRPVTLVEQSRMPSGKKAIVIRRATGADRDVVALAPDATAADLNVALKVLEAMHLSYGASVPRDVAAAVSAPASVPVRGKLLGIFMAQLRSSRARTVAGFGQVKSLQIRVPMKGSGTLQRKS